jgi:hypothetical protein
MGNAMITNCRINPEPLAMIKECMNTVGMDYVAPNSEWPWNVISKSAVAYSCGKIAREGEKVEHNHDPGELELCMTLAEEAAKVMAGIEIGMGSEAALGTGTCFPSLSSQILERSRLNELVRISFVRHSEGLFILPRKYGLSLS